MAAGCAALALGIIGHVALPLGKAIEADRPPHLEVSPYQPTYMPTTVAVGTAFPQVVTPDPVVLRVVVLPPTVILG